MKPYLDLLRRILDEGEDVPTGAYLPSEGRQPHARSLTGVQYVHDLRDGFPAVTTKRLYWESVVKELLWFLRGETYIHTLGCHIWDSWADDNGDCGPIYGAAWRRWEYPVFNGDFADEPFVEQAAKIHGVSDVAGTVRWDQVGDLVARLKAVAANPYDRSRRRLVVSAWNAPEVPNMRLAPCHTLWQVIPVHGRLDFVAHWRSIDMFTGFPFNAASYALLVHLLAGLVGMVPGVMKVTIADCHLYDNQIHAVREQLGRVPLDPPTLEIAPEVFTTAPDLSVEQCCLLKPEHFQLAGYKHHEGALKAEVAV